MTAAVFLGGFAAVGLAAASFLAGGAWTTCDTYWVVACVGGLLLLGGAIIGVFVRIPFVFVGLLFLGIVVFMAGATLLFGSGCKVLPW